MACSQSYIRQIRQIIKYYEYLLHHGVSNVNTRGKIRVVFNTGTQLQNTCLNNNILKGTYLLYNLFSVLLKFREGRYGIMSDI